MPLPPRPQPHVIYRARAPPPRPPPAAQPPHVAPRRASRLTAGVVPRAAGLRAPAESGKKPERYRKGRTRKRYRYRCCGRDTQAGADRTGPRRAAARYGADNPGVTGHHPIDGSMHGRAGVPWSDCAIVRPAPGEPARREAARLPISTTRARGVLVFIYHQVCARSVLQKLYAASGDSLVPARRPGPSLREAFVFVGPAAHRHDPRTTPRRHPTC
jgi:hypothetical protein